MVKLEAGDNFAIIQQEILMIRGCVHPNIIAYHGSYLRRDRLWIVMEYCSGGSLQDIYHSWFSSIVKSQRFFWRQTHLSVGHKHISLFLESRPAVTLVLCKKVHNEQYLLQLKSNFLARLCRHHGWGKCYSFISRS